MPAASARERREAQGGLTLGRNVKRTPAPAPASCLTLGPARALFRLRIGDPDTAEGRAALECQSPLTSAGKITAPVLIVQGAIDPRAPIRIGLSLGRREERGDRFLAELEQEMRRLDARLGA